MAKTYIPNDSDELRRDLQNASQNDTVILPLGVSFIDRIYSVEKIKIIGGGNHPNDSVIKPLPGIGRVFRDQGGSTFENFSAYGGGSIIEAEGHGTTIKDFISWYSNVPVKISGNDNLFDGGLIYQAGRCGIEVNGGFYMIPELSDRPFRLKKEIGLLAAEPSQEWDDGQKAIFEDLYYHRNMNTTIRNVVGVKCGSRGGMRYGGFIKAVPCAGGITLEDNVAIECLNDYWNDFPSDTKFTIRNNLSVRTIANSIFVEGYLRGTAKADIYGNLVVGADRSLFVSAFPEAKSWDNTFFFHDYGKVVHGLTGNRENKNVGCVTPSGENPDKLIALRPETYQAHQVAASEANYDFNKDHLYNTFPLLGDALRTESPNNNYGPFLSLSNVDIYQPGVPTTEELEVFIGDKYRLDKVLSVLRQKVVFTENPDPIIDPPKNTDIDQAALFDMIEEGIEKGFNNLDLKVSIDSK